MRGEDPFRPFGGGRDGSPDYGFVDILWIVHATAGQTGGRFSVIEQFMPAGSGPPPHVHAIEDEKHCSIVWSIAAMASLWPPKSTNRSAPSHR